jgi:hypothetical protein
MSLKSSKFFAVGIVNFVQVIVETVCEQVWKFVTLQGFSGVARIYNYKRICLMLLISSEVCPIVPA